MTLKAQILNVILISLCCFFGGSALLFGITGGVRAFLFSPILAVFGWFFYPLALIYVALIWWMFAPAWGIPIRVLFIVLSAVIGAVGMLSLGFNMVETHKEWTWRIAYCVSGGISTGLSAFLVTVLKK